MRTASSLPVPVGQSLRAYSIVKRIGEGSFGTASLATHVRTGASVVIKTVSLVGLNAVEVEAAQREATTLLTLSHPNIIGCIEAFSEKNELHIVTDFADCGDLSKFIEGRRGVALSEGKLLTFFTQICLALAFMHRRRTLHRDLKLANVFLASDGADPASGATPSIRVGDLGIARALKNTQEMAKTVVGTPYYLAPEICENRPYSHKADVWAAGACLYELATFRHPFEGSSLPSLVRRILRGEYAPLPPAYSPGVSDVIAMMLNLKPGARPSFITILKLPIIRPYVIAFARKCEQHGRALPMLDEVLPQDGPSPELKPHPVDAPPVDKKEGLRQVLASVGMPGGVLVPVPLPVLVPVLVSSSARPPPQATPSPYTQAPFIPAPPIRSPPVLAKGAEVPAVPTPPPHPARPQPAKQPTTSAAPPSASTRLQSGGAVAMRLPTTSASAFAPVIPTGPTPAPRPSSAGDRDTLLVVRNSLARPSSVGDHDALLIVRNSSARREIPLMPTVQPPKQPPSQPPSQPPLQAASVGSVGSTAAAAAPATTAPLSRPSRLDHDATRPPSALSLLPSGPPPPPPPPPVRAIPATPAPIPVTVAVLVAAAAKASAPALAPALAPVLGPAATSPAIVVEKSLEASSDDVAALSATDEELHQLADALLPHGLADPLAYAKAGATVARVLRLSPAASSSSQGGRKEAEAEVGAAAGEGARADSKEEEEALWLSDASDSSAAMPSLRDTLAPLRRGGGGGGGGGGGFGVLNGHELPVLAAGEERDPLP